MWQISDYISWLPYSGKLSREKTFANWWTIRFSWRKLSWIARFCRTKGCHATKFWVEKFCIYPQNREICESFLPWKFSTISLMLRHSAIKVSFSWGWISDILALFLNHFTCWRLGNASCNHQYVKVCQPILIVGWAACCLHSNSWSLLAHKHTCM